jgi:sugar (pentulose or hexulose) kinase
MSSECVVALDAGSGSGRTAVFDLEGNLLATVAEDWAPHIPEDEPLGAEFNPQEVWSTLCRTTRQALERAQIDPARVQAISATSQRDGVVFLDRERHELCCSTNRDARGLTYAEQLAHEHGQTIYSISGRWPLGLDALARLWWFRERRPEAYEQIAHVLMISDWLIYRLSGELCSEPTNASSSMLFDVVECSWSSELAERLGFSSHIYPQCHWPGDAVGKLDAQAAKALGLPPGITVAMGAADSQAAGLGCGAFDDGEVVVVAGTTMPVQIVLSRPALDESRRLQLGAYVTPNRWVLESNAGLAGIAYRWFCECFVGVGMAYYRRLEDEMLAAKPGEVLTVLGPQIADFRQLSFPPKSTFVFPFLAGLEHPPTRGSFGRAILENIAFAARGNLEQLTQASETEVSSLNMCGGLARSPLLVQILAAVCQREVHVPMVREASSLGAAVCAAVGAGAYSTLPSAAKAMVQWDPVVEPDSASVRAYRGLFRKWKRLYEQAQSL